MRAVFGMIKCEMGRAYDVARDAADGIEELSEIHSMWVKPSRTREIQRSR